MAPLPSAAARSGPHATTVDGCNLSHQEGLSRGSPPPFVASKGPGTDNPLSRALRRAPEVRQLPRQLLGKSPAFWKVHCAERFQETWHLP